uniref:Uncharacterized protein n=1 Tax=Strigamia maritima TaxID=126957 RepID=T1II59_STRMM
MKIKPIKEKKVKQSLEDALNQIDVEELRSILLLDVQRFTDTPLVWLKDLVNYLNIKLNIQTKDVVFSGKPVDYPLSSVPVSLQSIIVDLFDKCPRAALQVFFEHLIVNCIDDEIKALPTFGHRIVMQSLAFTMPSIGQKSLEKFKQLRTQHQSRPSSCLTLLWAVGQCGHKDFSIGLKIWLEFLLPIMGIHSYSQYVIDYLDILFAAHSNVHSCNKILGIREFFTVLDVIFTHSSNLPTEQQKQLLSLYPKLKTVAL